MMWKVKIGIMQPYFVPYMGYWQLMNMVDKYVVYDDVNYINRGWINRNRILVDGKIHYFNVPILKASQNKKINEIYVNKEGKLQEKNLRMIEAAYHKAPYFNEVFSLVEQIIYSDKEILSEYIYDSFLVICRYLQIETELIMSSHIEKDNSLKGQKKILSICELLGATEYYNAIGGMDLYSRQEFQKNHISLYFLKSNQLYYQQFDDFFYENLSIIDVLMFNSQNQVMNMLQQYTII